MRIKTKLLLLLLSVAALWVIPHQTAKAIPVDTTAPAIVYDQIYTQEFTNASAREVWLKINTAEYSAYYNLYIKNIDSNNGLARSLECYIYDTDGAEVKKWEKNDKTESDNWVKLKQSSTYYLRFYGTLLSDSTKGSYKFSLSCEPDDADEKLEATKYRLDTEVSATIRPATDTDWFVFHTKSYEAYYYFYFKNIDIYNGIAESLTCNVYDKDGARLESVSSRSASENDFWLKLDKDSVYYVQFTGSLWEGYNLGSYKFKVSPERDDPDSRTGKLTSLSYGKQYEKTLRAASDLDWFKFKTKSYSAVYNFEIKNINIAGLLTVNIVDASDQTLSTITVGNAAVKKGSVKLKSNKTYYVKVSGNTAGKYLLKLTDTEEVGDTRSTAMEIREAKTYKSSIDAPGDVDWFKFKAQSGKQYTISMTNLNISGTVFLSIYKGSKKLGSISAPLGRTARKKIELKKGTTYSLKVENGSSVNTGAYKIRAK